MIRKLYYRLPAVIQDALVTLEGYRVHRERLGREFRNRLQDYLDRDNWDEDQISAYKTTQRAAALERAAHAPFYRAWFESGRADWRDFVDVESFRSIPILTKADLVANPSAYLTRAPVRTDRIISTSGTSGTSLQFPISAEVEADQWAVWWRYRMRLGIQPGMRCGLFASAPILAPDSVGRPYRINRSGNEIRFSIFHISLERIRSYAEAFERHKIRWIHGNPTAISQFCTCYLKSGLSKPIKIDYLTVGSENLTAWQIASMEAVFGMRPYQHYGQAEAVANISELPDGRLAVDEDFSNTEFVDDPHSDLKRIIGTNFSNTAIALLRYDTGDLCTLAEGCREDGGQCYVETLDGRSTDYIQLPNGRRVASLAGPFHASKGLAEAQIVQHTDYSLTVLYIPGQGWQDKTTLTKLEEELRKRIGLEISLKFERVETIAKTPRGKSKLIVSKLDK